jgi:AhpD family alkylhydroperoxidase
MDLGIAGRRAIVCASSRGPGRACAEALAREGVDVTINGRNADTLEETARAIRARAPVTVKTVAGDVASEETRAALLEACPQPDIVVNNNGGPPPGAVNGPGTVDPGLKQMVAYVASNAAGCRYCQAHTSARASHAGVQVEKIEHAFEFETHAVLSDAERAALRLARDSALVPNLVEAEHFADLRRHFDEPQIVELVAVCALFGFLNRWNDTMSTELEGVPRSFAERHLEASGWDAGKHR